MQRKPKVTVIGSANVDLVIETDRFPSPGETILGNTFHQFLGGKGANQAVAASRLGADVTFIGSVGEDIFGQQIVDNLRKEKVNVEHVLTIPTVSSGIANIQVAENDNIITVIPGANANLTEEYIQSLSAVIVASDIVVLQLEIPLEAVTIAIEIADKGNVPVILNPAPAVPLPEDLLRKVTFITPNETEMAILTSNAGQDFSVLFQQMFALGSKSVVMTYGKHGVIYGERQRELQNYPALTVQAIDTTGAGDTFNAAFAVCIACGKSVEEAIVYANAAAALSITKLGAQTGMPTEDEVNRFLKRLSD
ncbi:ribokinase [Sporosarcina oncorhynchi]|uniref:Ribokinase n=1 Tax=Sporosarcina oncorhynchi TaxID=3056444 RepID=A0ABZ0L6G6_9BACL|nr:ribokinase [Sporosarcina sp. T2O-4]WOV88161.1 ribokinase [Sporosarcina sp. T2O-4]